MNDKRRNLILVRILDQIQQDNEDARDSTEKFIATTCNKEGISFEQVFYILFFDAVFISNKSSFSFKIREFILGQLITLLTPCLQLYVCQFFCSFSNYLCEMIHNSSLAL